MARQSLVHKGEGKGFSKCAIAELDPMFNK